MAEVDRAHHPGGSLDRLRDSEGLTRDTHSLTPSEPQQPFIFPILNQPTVTIDGNETPLQDLPVGASRRSVTRNRPNHLSLSKLPAFEFGGDSLNKSSPSPTRSPARTTPPIISSGGHRRHGSEYVGGNAANPIAVNASPTRSEGLQPPTPPAGPSSHPRRGHAHRRSGALSQHDLSAILKPTGHNQSGGSKDLGSEPHALTTPPDVNSSLLGHFSRSSQSSFLAAGESDGNQSRPKVTFSSDPEYVLRPLSTISSETSSSLSTVRAGHSVTDSITSVVSGGASSPLSSMRNWGAVNPSSEPGLSSLDFQVASSPGPANTSERVSPDSMSIHPDDQPFSAPIDQHFNQPSISSPSNATNEHVDSLEDASQVAQSNNDLAERPTICSPTISESSQLSQQPHDRAQRPRTSPQTVAPKRQRKVRSWAGHLLPKKTKQSANHEKSTNESSDQSRPYTSSADGGFSLENVTFDEDTTCIIENAPSPSLVALESPTKRSDWETQFDEPPFEDSGHMLDLDLALGPTDRPSTAGRGSEYGGASSAKRRMHSSGETGGFMGPGMHYHRRAESAPEMDMFEANQFGFLHRSSNPAMAEAIEEEEEDDDSQANKQQDAAKQQTALGVHVIDAISSDEQEVRPRRRPSARVEEQREHSSNALEATALTKPDEVENAIVEEQPRLSVITKSSDESTVTPTATTDPHDILTQSAHTTSVDQDGHSFHTMPQMPPYAPSPDYVKTSFEKPEALRIHTAHSSMTDRMTLNSSRYGEQGPGSIDDVPSLTSSASTMISGHPTSLSSGVGPAFPSGERSFSLSAATPARLRSGTTSKRSSLVSLSRLVGSAPNKSKLNIAQLPPESPEKSDKKKKRISRLMFWKSREKLSAA